MFKLISLLAITLTFWFSPADAAKAVPSGTIAIVEAGPYQLGQTIHFSWTATGLKGNQHPRIQLVCDQSGFVVYGEAQPAPGNAFTLGGGYSLWLETLYRPNSSTCAAQLYFWDFHPTQTYIPLSPVLNFTAAGLP